MIGLDTCVLVRLLSDDDPVQAERAASLMRENTVFLPDTVLLETEWVLRSRYKKGREDLINFFRLLLEVENVVLEDHFRFETAVKWYALGADFADAMHLAACNGTMLYTFDRDFCKHARDGSKTPIVQIVEE